MVDYSLVCLFITSHVILINASPDTIEPTGFNPALFLPPPGQFAPPAPPPQKDVSPASVFAQMKSGTFINNDQGPQSAGLLLFGFHIKYYF